MERVVREERLQFAAARRVPTWTQVSPTMQDDTRDSITAQPSVGHTAKFRWLTLFFQFIFKMKSQHLQLRSKVVYRLCDANI